MKFKFPFFLFFIIQFYSHYVVAYTDSCKPTNPNGSPPGGSGNGYVIVSIPDDVVNIQYDSTFTGVLKEYNVLAIPGLYNPAKPGFRNCAPVYVGNFTSPWVATGTMAHSNIPGISVEVMVSTFSRPFPFRIDASQTASPTYDNLTWNVRIVKTGNVTSGGTIIPNPLATFSQSSAISQIKTAFGLSQIKFNNYRINVISCSIKNNTSSHNIEMGDWYDSNFPSIGSTSDSVDIPITLTCQAGANVKATVTSSAGYADANSGKLNLSGSNSATGIAIQLLDKNNAPIKLNSQINLQDNVPAGDYLFNWKARYIRTGDKVTVGTANSVATVSIQYQ